jgi:hypothetical protein
MYDVQLFHRTQLTGDIQVLIHALQVGGIAVRDVVFVPATGFNKTYHLKAPVDGILGLSFQEGSQGPSRSAPNTNLIREPVFSIYIKKWVALALL